MSENKNQDYIEAFGAVASAPDIRDYKLAASTIASSKALPEEFELSMPHIKNQGSVGSCVAHALSTIVEFFNSVNHNIDEQMSVGYIYGNRDNSSYKGEGMILRDAIAAVCGDGNVPYVKFPYNEEVPGIIDKFNSHKEGLTDLAEKSHFASYFKVATEAEIKTALSNRIPIAFSIAWHKDIKVKDGVITTSQQKQSGYHCMVLYGWDKRGWKIQNSWGSLWGKGGRAILPYTYNIQEAYGIIDDPNSSLTLERPFKAKTAFGKWLVRVINKLYGLFYRLKCSFSK